VFLKRKKCATCKNVLKEQTGIHELRINTADGTMDLEICSECADFLDKSADVLLKGQKNEQRI
jgi:DNA/RNA endonuclease YhcR with UshA esterase domain